MVVVGFGWFWMILVSFFVWVLDDSCMFLLVLVGSWCGVLLWFWCGVLIGSDGGLVGSG
jgi:hypothetical protein